MRLLLHRWADTQLRAENERLRHRGDDYFVLAQRLGRKLRTEQDALRRVRAIQFNRLGAGGQVEALEADGVGEAVAFYAGTARALATVRAAIQEAVAAARGDR